mgnify:CR=1 FL=1
MKKTALLASILLASLLLPACGSQTAQAPSPAPGTLSPAIPPSATPDLCTQASMPETVQIVNDYVKEFDKYASQAVHIYPTPNSPYPAVGVPMEQLPQITAWMKGIRQALLDQAVPPCLTSLKQHALQYMDTVVLTLVTYGSSHDLETLNAGISLSAYYNDRYANEMANLLGVTLAAPDETPIAQETPTPAATSTPAVITVLNPGPNPLNLRVAPSLTAQAVAVLHANESATAVGRTANSEWVRIEMPAQPGSTAWVYASLLQFTGGNIEDLPVVTP